MEVDSAAPPQESHTKAKFGNLTPDQRLAFDAFKERCRTEGLLEEIASENGDDLKTGICDDGTLLRFLRARRFNVQNALQQYQTTRTWRDNNRLLELYENIEAEDYEETRKLYTHWTGRRDKHGLPCCWFEIKQLTPDVMSAYNASCASSKPLPVPEGKGGKAESTAMLRLFCTYDSLVRFVMPLCSAVSRRPNPETPVTGTNCIIDISGVGLLQFWKLRTHMQAASTLATAHYPETLGRTYVIGAPTFFPTIWGWIKTWFDQNTVSKIVIVPAGKEFSALCESYDPADIPRKYGGEFDFDFGMPPSLDPEIKAMLTWLSKEDGEKYVDLPMGPMRWRNSGDGKRTAVAVGRVNGIERNCEVMALDRGAIS